jgi:hypothetical protein
VLISGLTDWFHMSASVTAIGQGPADDRLEPAWKPTVLLRIDPAQTALF